MATRAEKVKVGVFALVSAVVIVGGIALVQGYTASQTVEYDIEFNESVLGLYQGSHVVYLGVPVGKVKDIWVTPDNAAHVDIEIEADKVTLHAGVKARLVLYSLATGALAITLFGGEPTQPELPPNSLIPTEPSLLQSVTGETASMMEHLSEILATVETSLEGLEEGELTDIIRDTKALIQDTKDSVASISETLTRVAGQIETGVETYKQLAESVKRTADSTNRLITTLHEKVGSVDMARLDQNLNAVLEKSDDLMGRLGQVADSMEESAQAVLYDADTMQYRLQETLTVINETLEALRQLVAYLQQDPSALIRGKGRTSGDR